MKTITLNEYDTKAKYISIVQSKLTMQRTGLCEYKGIKYTVYLGSYGIPVLNNNMVDLREYNAADYLEV